MKIIDKLFYKKDKKTNEKKLSKLKIIGMSLLIIIVLFVIVSGIIALMPVEVTEAEARELIYNNTPGSSLEEKADYILATYSYGDKNYIGSSYVLTLARESGINLDLSENVYVAAGLISYDKDKDEKLNKTELMNLLDYKK